MTQIQKRHLGIIAAAMAVVIVGAIGLGNSYANNQDSISSFKITKGEAAQIAANHLGTDLSNLVEIDVDKEDGTFLYSVDFIIGDEDVSVEIDPQTGKILVVEKEPVGAPDDDDDDNDEDYE
ncbi:MAG: PepSY domain-containing protein [Nitrosopumilaceae archaeon]